MALNFHLIKVNTRGSDKHGKKVIQFDEIDENLYKVRCHWLDEINQHF